MEARREVKEAMEEAVRSGAIDVYVPLRFSGLIERHEGNFAAALELQERALALAAERPGSFRRALTLLEVGMLHVELGNYDAAVTALEEARDSLWARMGSSRTMPRFSSVSAAPSWVWAGLERPFHSSRRRSDSGGSSTPRTVGRVKRASGSRRATRLSAVTGRRKKRGSTRLEILSQSPRTRRRAPRSRCSTTRRIVGRGGSGHSV